MSHRELSVPEEKRVNLFEGSIIIRLQMTVQSYF